MILGHLSWLLPLPAMSRRMNWAAARRNQTARRLTRETRADAARYAEGSTTDLPFPAPTLAQRDFQQFRFRRIAERHAPTSRFCAGVMAHVHAGHQITPAQARVLLAIEADDPRRPDTTTRTLAQTISCPNCHAHPGEPCRGRHGPRTSCHLERHHAYLSAEN